MSVTGFNLRRRELAKKLTEKEQVQQVIQSEESKDNLIEAPTVKSLDKMTAAELKEKAKLAGIEGADHMKKADLVAALSGVKQDDGSGSAGHDETKVQNTD